jgi:catechol 2,3-dioxygenase-like lactoylglutathione lyase family enzyme
MCTHDVLTALLHKGETMNIELKARGLCVRDLSQSVRFYQDALGFVPQCPAHAINASRLPGSGELGAAQGHLQSMRNAQGVELLLSELKHPHPGGPAERRPNNQYGLTHLAFWVDDIQRSAECVVAAGGRVYPHTRAYFAEARVTLMYATDPNGIRVELMHSAQEAERFSHSGICTVAIDAALDFYSGLDFTQAERFDLQGEWLDTINELEGIQLSAQMARNTQGDTLELLQIDHPSCFGALERAPLQSYGFNFMLLSATDLNAAANTIEASGGHVHFRAQDQQGLCGLSCSDPNGVRLEILRRQP